jgi:hypothetical protein
MRVLVAVLALASLSCMGLACGGESRSAGSTARSASKALASDATTKTVRGLGPSGHEDTDGDYDFDSLAGNYGQAALEQDRRAVMAVATSGSGAVEVEALQSSRSDADHDFDNHQAILAFGHTADATDQRAVTAVVKRYYAIAAAGDGAKACSLLVPSLATTVALDYGRTPHLKGGSCPAVMSKLFERRHRELALDRDTLVVLPVRVQGDLGVALLSTDRSSREAQIVLRREHGAWKLDALLDGPRPIDGEAR